MNQRAALGWATGMALLSGTAPAVAKDKQSPPPAVLQEIGHCRTLTDDAARLQCFDSAADRLTAALTRKEVYVLDRTEVRETRRQLFGLPLPKEGLLSEKADAPVQVDRIEGVVVAVSQTFDGNWRVTLDQGGVWEQTDGYQLARGPRKGDKVVVMRAALGSYKIRFGTQPGVRARRVS